MSLRLLKISLFFFFCFLLLPSTILALKSQEDQHIEVSLRMIGHQLLLNSGDSTSRVLPIRNEEGRYRIQFESEFEFVPDELVQTVNQVILDANLSQGYFVEVEECETTEVVYSYEMSRSDSKDNVSCVGREQPKGCYSLLITFIEDQELDISSDTIDQNQPEKPEKGKKQVKYSLLSFIGVVAFGAIFFIWRRRQKSLIDPHLIALGKFKFDRRNAELIMEQQKIELTGKEADLLLLLYNNVNSTVEREVILSRVWGDEGDYVGRTLDVFISKLRKKLESDPTVKIVNIRGVGYKLILGE